MGTAIEKMRNLGVVRGVGAVTMVIGSIYSLWALWVIRDLVYTEGFIVDSLWTAALAVGFLIMASLILIPGLLLITFGYKLAKVSNKKNIKRCMMAMCVLFVVVYGALSEPLVPFDLPFLYFVLFVGVGQWIYVVACRKLFKIDGYTPEPREFIGSGTIKTVSWMIFFAGMEITQSVIEYYGIEYSRGELTYYMDAYMLLEFGRFAVPAAFAIVFYMVTTLVLLRPSDDNDDTPLASPVS